MFPVAILIVIAVISGGAGLFATETEASQNVSNTESDDALTEPEIIEVYPNTPKAHNRGEFVTVAFPPNASFEGYELADNHRRMPLTEQNTTATNASVESLPASPRETANGVVTFTSDVGLLSWLTNRTVAPLTDVRPAQAGDTIRLVYEGETVDSVQYGRASQGDVYDVRANEWRPLGATDKPVVATDGGYVEAFVLPDESTRTVEFLADATDRVLLGGYTLSSPAVVETLIDAIERGVDVKILVDAMPVGGMTGDEATALDTLSRAGATVRVSGGEFGRYRHHHPKYAVVDDAALVTTENWKPSGIGGKANRGWAAITNQSAIVSGLVSVFRADTNWVDAVPWDDHSPTLVDDEFSTGSHPTQFEATELPVERTSLLLAPENAKTELHAAIADADQSIAVKQVQISDPNFALLDSLIDAATRGVEVRILLSGAWYVEDDNRELKRWLTDQAETQSLPLSVRVATGGAAFEQIHAKGVVIDDQQVILGSMNWNDNSMKQNREVGLLLEGAAVGEYFTEVFEMDWEDGDAGGDDEWELPVGVGLTVIGGVMAVILGAMRIEFEPRQKTESNGKPPSAFEPGYGFLTLACLITRCNGVQKSHTNRCKRRVIR